MKVLFTSCCLLLALALVKAQDQQLQQPQQPSVLQECFDKDSISCLQLTFFRQAKELFDDSNLELVGGVSLTKTAESRQAKALDENVIGVEQARSFEDRNSQIQSYMYNQLASFFQDRQLNFNFANAARSISNAIPEEIKEEMRGLKKKKLFRKLKPFLMGLKVKAAILGALAIVAAIFIAKKALLISFIALGVSLFSGFSQKSSGLFSGLGNLFGGGQALGGGYSAGGGSAGWSSVGGGNSGWDSHGSYSSPVAQTAAYSGYEQARRR